MALDRSQANRCPVELVPAFAGLRRYPPYLAHAVRISPGRRVRYQYDRDRLGAVERYSEVPSGAFIALLGLAFWAGPFFNCSACRFLATAPTDRVLTSVASLLPHFDSTMFVLVRLY